MVAIGSPPAVEALQAFVGATGIVHLVSATVADSVAIGCLIFTTTTMTSRLVSSLATSTAGAAALGRFGRGMVRGVLLLAAANLVVNRRRGLLLGLVATTVAVFVNTTTSRMSSSCALSPRNPSPFLQSSSIRVDTFTADRLLLFLLLAVVKTTSIITTNSSIGLNHSIRKDSLDTYFLELQVVLVNVVTNGTCTTCCCCR